MGKIVYLTGSAENSLYDLLLLSHQTGKDQQNELFRKASSILQYGRLIAEASYSR